MVVLYNVSVAKLELWIPETWATFGRQKWDGSSVCRKSEGPRGVRCRGSSQHSGASAGSPGDGGQQLQILVRFACNSTVKRTSSSAGRLHHRSWRIGGMRDWGGTHGFPFIHPHRFQFAPAIFTSPLSILPPLPPTYPMKLVHPADSDPGLDSAWTDCTDCITSSHNHVCSNPHNIFLTLLKVVLQLWSNFNWYRIWNQSEWRCNENLRHVHWLWDWPWTSVGGGSNKHEENILGIWNEGDIFMQRWEA